MKLYYAPRTRATRARWLLEELGVQYELVRSDPSRQEHRAPAHLALSPLGEVPVLVDGDLVLFESAAICLHLADRFPGLAPAPGTPERGRWYQWLLFAERHVEAVALAHRDGRTPEGPGAAQVLAVVDAALDGDHLVGDRFTAADVVMASTLHLAHHVGLLADHPRLVTYVARHTARPASRRAVS